MAKTVKTKLEEIEINEPEVVRKVVKKVVIEVETPKVEKQTYIVDIKWQVGDKLYRKGDTIELTKEGYKFYKKLNKVK